MTSRDPSSLLVVLLAAIIPATSVRATTLVQDGAGAAVIVAASDATTAAERLNALLSKETGASLAVLSPAAPTPAGKAEVILCTLASRAEVQNRLSAGAGAAGPAPQGFFIGADTTGNGRVEVVGAEPAGLRYGIGELWTYRLRIAGRTASVPSPLNVTAAPAFSKRLFWNWTHLTNWDSDLSRIHQTRYIDPGGTLEPYLEQPDGYERLFKGITDYLADHKLNALILWGFVNDAHGGVASAQRLSAYARAQSVRLLPGIGTIGYGGFYFGGDHPYNIYTFLRDHPEVELMLDKDGKPVPLTPCAADPVFQQWLRDGAAWFFSTFTDIGGVNLEHGDFFECQNPSCLAERAKPENDDNFWWDMMYTQLPVIQVGLGIRSDLWFTYSPYVGYDAAMMTDPPKFLSQYPAATITQWTYSHMVADPYINPGGLWPSQLHPPAGTNHSIGLLHQGSIWDVKRQWWGTPNGTYSLIPEVIRWTCARAIQDGSEGVELVGQVGPVSPQNELNYLAFEAFTWNPQMTLQDWIQQRLAPVYGGSVLAGRFYQLVSDETRDPDLIEAARLEAVQTAGGLADARQTRRWTNLASELARRHELSVAVATERVCDNSIDDDGDTLTDCADPDCAATVFCTGTWQAIQPTGDQDAPIYGDFVERSTPYGFWGKGHGGGMVVVGMHTFPAGLSASGVGRAILRLPRTDNAFSADESCLDLTMLVKHIDAADDSLVTLADKASAPLADIGIYRSPGPYIPDDSRFVEFNVTDRVRADLNTGRAVFAWRIEPESIPDSVTSYRYLPTVDNVYPPADNRAKLFLFPPAPAERLCADGVDNDGDGDLDCLDPDCDADPACRARPDFDLDGDVDQEDYGHFQSCLTSYITDPLTAGCGNADFNQDGRVDLVDFGVFQGCVSGALTPYARGCDPR